MNADEKTKTLFLNGKEVDSFNLTGDEKKDMAAARRLLAEQDIEEAHRRTDLVADVAAGCLAGACGPT
jgi:hypothetical protein